MKSIISIIMLTYNRAHLVPRAIESVLNQSFSDFEFIIVDNGSIDNSREICDRYVNKDSRLHVISKEKGNIGSGRNVGLDAAKGEYVMFVDDDDYAYPDMLATLHDLAVKHDAQIAFCASDKEVNGVISPNCTFEGELVMTVEEAVTELLWRKKLNAASPTKLWHRSLFNKIRFSEEGHYDDITVVYKLFAEASRIVGTDKPLYCFYRHPKNNSGFTTNDALLTPKQLDEYFEAFRERTIYLSAKLPAIAEFVQYTEWSYMISMVNKIISNDLQNCSDQLSHARKCLTQNFEEFYNSKYLLDFEREFMDKYILSYFKVGP